MRAGSSQRATEGNRETGRGELTTRVTTGDRIADKLIDVTIQSPCSNAKRKPRPQTGDCSVHESAALWGGSASGWPPLEAGAFGEIAWSATKRQPVICPDRR